MTKLVEILTEEQREEVVRRLQLGEPYMAIARKLHDQGIVINVKLKTLTEMIRRFSKTRAEKEIREDVANAILDAKGRIRKRINTLDELEELIHMQKDRLERVIKAEDGKPLTLAMVSTEIDRLADLLERLTKYQLETGILRRAPKEIEGHLTVGHALYPEPIEGAITYKVTPDLLKYVETLEGEYTRREEEDERA